MRCRETQQHFAIAYQFTPIYFLLFVYSSMNFVQVDKQTKVRIGLYLVILRFPNDVKIQLSTFLQKSIVAYPDGQTSFQASYPR